MTTIDFKRITDQITPADVIEYYTGQKPVKGKYRCPFHDDRHPSLVIKKNYFKCWACGEYGGVIDFVKRLYGLSTIEAARKLADDFGLNITPDGKPDQLEQIRLESNRKNREEVARIKVETDEKIKALCAAHRVLLKFDAPRWQLEMYEHELDELTQ